MADQEVRDRWTVLLAECTADQFIFVDESSSQARRNDRPYGWSPKGYRCRTRPRAAHRKERYSILPAITINGYIACEVVEGSFDNVRFTNFLRDRVLPLVNPLPGPQSVVVMDNASSHHTQRETIEEMFREVGAKIEYLLAYSPDLNSIETSFNSLKAWLERKNFLAEGYKDNYAELLYRGIETTMQDGYAINYFNACGIVVE